MSRKQNSLVPIGEVISGPSGPVKAIRDDSPQGGPPLHPSRSGEPDPERGFMARMMALCSLPRTNPGNRLQYKRANGPYTLYMIAGG